MTSSIAGFGVLVLDSSRSALPKTRTIHPHVVTRTMQDNVTCSVSVLPTSSPPALVAVWKTTLSKGLPTGGRSYLAHRDRRCQIHSKSCLLEVKNINAPVARKQHFNPGVERVPWEIRIVVLVVGGIVMGWKVHEKGSQRFVKILQMKTPIQIKMTIPQIKTRRVCIGLDCTVQRCCNRGEAIKLECISVFPLPKLNRKAQPFEMTQMGHPFQK